MSLNVVPHRCIRSVYGFSVWGWDIYRGPLLPFIPSESTGGYQTNRNPFNDWRGPEVKGVESPSTHSTKDSGKGRNLRRRNLVVGVMDGGKRIRRTPPLFSSKTPAPSYLKLGVDGEGFLHWVPFTGSERYDGKGVDILPLLLAR